MMALTAMAALASTLLSGNVRLLRGVRACSTFWLARKGRAAGRWGCKETGLPSWCGLMGHQLAGAGAVGVRLSTLSFA